jgi:hypothetical protein
VLLEIAILVMLALALLGTLPTWPHSREWGYGPSGVIGVVFIVLLVLMLTTPVGN